MAAAAYQHQPAAASWPRKWRKAAGKYRNVAVGNSASYGIWLKMASAFGVNGVNGGWRRRRNAA